jgi:hypothetical protein
MSSKCDQAKPSCGRCTRLDIPCIGAGQQRYKFTEPTVVGGDATVSRPKTHSPSPAKIAQKAPPTRLVIRSAPSSDVASLTKAFISVLYPTADLRYSLAWGYGDYLRELAPRLGVNDALDAAVATVVVAHSDFCSSRPVSPGCLQKYAAALKGLRMSLNDDDTAVSNETLCAVMVMLVCQDLMGSNAALFSGHTEGAAQLLKARGCRLPRNDFERLLLSSVVGPLVRSDS